MLLEWIAKTFDLSTVRARSTLRAAGFHFLFVASITALKSSTNALYLARRDPADLPWLYLGTAGIVAAITVLLGNRLGVMSAKPILRRSLSVVAVLLTIFGTLAALDVRAGLGVLYVTGEAAATALSILFWARLGEVFDVRAAKRVFGAIGAAGMAGAVVGGLAVTAMTKVDAPSEIWVFAAAIGLLASRPLIGRSDAQGMLRRERVSLGQGLAYAVQGKFPLSVATLVLLFAVHASSIDFVFRLSTHHFEGGHEASMAAMFGLLNAVVGVAAIGFQSAITARLLKRLGVFAYLSIVPGLSVVAALVAFAMPTTFAPLFVMKALEMMGSYSLNATGLQLLYNPMPEAVRGSVRAVIDGAVKKLGAALGGLMLLLLGGLLIHQDLLALVIALGSLLLLWIALLRPLYLVALEQKLGDRGLSVLPVIDPTERSTRQQMVRALYADDAGTVLAAISVLSELDDFDFSPHIAALIAHPAEAVRLKAIGLVKSAPDPAYVPFLVSVIRDRARHHKAQAARALVAIDPGAARRVLEPILSVPDGLAVDEPGLTSAAIAAFLGDDPDDADPVVRLARNALESMLEALPERSPAERRRLARLLGMLGPGPYAHHLGELLEDSNITVRSAAIDAATLAPDARLPEFLIRELGDRGLQRAVRSALAVYGDAAVPMLARFLDDRRIEVGVRVQVPAILRMIGTKTAADAMLFSNRQDDAYLRYVIIVELTRMRRQHPDLKFDRPQTEGAALRRLRAYTHYRPIHADLVAGGEPFELVARAIDDRVRQNLQAGLRLLGLLFDMKAMESAYFGFLQGNHADAVELVDVALDGAAIRDEVLSHVEPMAPPGQAKVANERAFALVEGRDVLLASVAWQTLRRMGEHPPDV